MSDIEKIRAEVAKVREEHYRVEGYADYCGASHAPGTLWPCRFLQLAEDKLKLAEGLDAAIQALRRLDFPETAEQLERMLSEVAR